MTEITTVTLRRLTVPLAEPYHLSRTTVEAFETILVEVTLADGRIGLGEVTPLEGYSDETIDESWSLLSGVSAELPRKEVASARSRIQEKLTAHAFPRSALDCALETASCGGICAVQAPIVGILSTNMPSEEAVESLDRQLEAGFEVIKVKVGFDAERDARRLQRIVEAAPETVVFRVDANQGYDLSEARRFLDTAPTERLQLVEQPLPVGRLPDHASLRTEYDMMLMLDEEISNGNDLRAAAVADAADAVKFKLMKAGGWKATKRRIEQAQDLGFEVVLGNGVQSDIGCIHEAVIWEATGLELAGEFNGWQKQIRKLTDNRLRFDNGALTFVGGSVSLDYERVNTYTHNRKRYAARE